MHPLFFFLPPLPSLSLSALGHPPQPGRLLFRLHPPFVLPFLLFYPVIRPRNPRLHPSSTSFQFLSTFSFLFHRSSSLLPSIQIGMLPRTSSCTSNQKPFMEKLLWGKGFSASVETNSNFRVRFFYFGSVPMNFCEPGFGSIPVGEVSIKFTGINVIPRVSKDRPPWVLGD